MVQAASFSTPPCLAVQGQPSEKSSFSALLIQLRTELGICKFLCAPEHRSSLNNPDDCFVEGNPPAMPSGSAAAAFAALAAAARRTRLAVSSYTGRAEVKSTAGLPGFTALLGLTNLPGFPATNAAATEEAMFHRRAAFPKLHASSLEVLCASGFLTVAQTSKDWAAMSQDTYAQSVFWLAGIANSGLQYVAAGGCKPTIPWLEPHLRLIGTVSCC